MYNETDFESAIKLISDIIVNEFSFKLDPELGQPVIIS